MVEPVGLQVFGNIGVEEIQFLAHRPGIGLADGRPAGTKALHLRSRQGDARLVGILDLVVETRLAVIRHDAVRALFSLLP